MIRKLAGLLLALLSSASLVAQERTVGLLLNEESASSGMTLFAPFGSTTTYLIDLEGRIVNSWESLYRPGSAVYLLEDGGILRCGRREENQGGLVQEFDWEGNLLWEYRFPGDTMLQHHDAIKLPSGNLLAVVWEPVSKVEAIALGRDPTTIPEEGLLVDMLVEIRPVGKSGGEIVWRWRALDHIVQEFDETKPNAGRVSEHPELIDFNYTRPSAGPTSDWLHINAVTYNEELDQVMISSPFLNEIMIVDHSTTIEEAAGSTGGRSGRGGDLLYRWGNPQVYGAEGEEQLFFQHNPTWVPEGYPGAGNILVFNNGDGRPEGAFSEVNEIIPPLNEDGTYAIVPGGAFGPAAPVWRYRSAEPDDFYSPRISGAQRLPGGSTLICSGMEGRVFEVASDGAILWEYLNPVSSDGILAQGTDPDLFDRFLFRAERYSPDHPAFAGRELVGGAYVELYPSGVAEEREILPEISIE